MYFRTEKAALRFAEADDFLADMKGVTRPASGAYEMEKENLPTKL
jgi:hypothetical protein